MQRLYETVIKLFCYIFVLKRNLNETIFNSMFADTYYYNL